MEDSLIEPLRSGRDSKPGHGPGMYSLVASRISRSDQTTSKEVLAVGHLNAHASKGVPLRMSKPSAGMAQECDQVPGHGIKSDHPKYL